MQRGRVFHFGSEAVAANPPPSHPWFDPEWCATHARHAAHWSQSRAWPSCRAESKAVALRKIAAQLREYDAGSNAVPGQGPASARVLLLMKSPNKWEVVHPASITFGGSGTGSVYSKLTEGILGSGATVFVTYIFPFNRVWEGSQIPTSAAEAFELYVKAVVRILSPKVIVCPGRDVAQYVRAACRAKNIPNVPDTPINEFIKVTIGRTPTHLYRIIHPFQTSDRCTGSSFQQRLEYSTLLRQGLEHICRFVTVSSRPLDITALLMRGEKVVLGTESSTGSSPLPGIDEPGHFVWARTIGRLATMDTPINKGQILHLCRHRKIRLVVNLAIRAHPGSWFRGIACRQVHCPIPDDGGVPGSVGARDAVVEIRKAMSRREAVAIHRTYGPGATGLMLRCLGIDLPYKLDLTPTQELFLRTWSKGDQPPVAGIELLDPIVDSSDDDSPPRKRKRPPVRYVVWLIQDLGKQAMLERAFQTQAEAETFVRRGNRALDKNSEARNRTRETSGLLGRPKGQNPKLYCLRANDTAVYELRDTETGRVIRRCYGKKPKDDPSGATVRQRKRNKRENGRIDNECWDQFSRGV